MKNLIISSLILASLGLVSCGKTNPLDGWKTDAKDGQPPEITQATPPSGQEKPTGDSDQSLRIITPDYMDFSEGVEGTYNISGLVLVPGATFELNISNAADFPNIKFDSSTGTITWTPQPGFGTGVGDVQHLPMNIEMVTHGGGPSRSASHSIPVYVHPAKQAPIVLSVTFEGGKKQMRENEVLKFDVVVKDATGSDVDGSRPTLTFAPAQDGSFEAASVVSYVQSGWGGGPNPVQNQTDKSLWTFHMQVDLTSREITTSSIDLKLNVVAVSRFDVRSAPFVSRLSILTSINTPVVSWTDTEDMTAGTKNSFTYMIFDPRGESDVQQTMITNCASIEPHLVCGTCTRNYNSAMNGDILLCPITWDIPAGYSPGGWSDTVTIEFSVSAKSKVYGDTYVTPTRKISRYIRIRPAPSAPFAGQTLPKHTTGVK